MARAEPLGLSRVVCAVPAPQSCASCLCREARNLTMIAVLMSEFLVTCQGKVIIMF